MPESLVRAGYVQCTLSRVSVRSAATLPRGGNVPSSPPIEQTDQDARGNEGSTAQEEAAQREAAIDSTESEPPLLVRAGLVGAATALATPAFPVIGFNQIAFRFLDPVTRMALAGGTSFIYFSCMTLMPNAFYYAPILLPFAVGNGATASAVYLAADKAAGGPKELVALNLAGGWIPVAGPAIGVTTALLTPLTFPVCWDVVFREPSDVRGMLFTDPDVYNLIWNVCYNSVGIPCLAVTGLAAGTFLHVLLRPIIVGQPGWHWHRLAGVVLAATSLGLVALYSTSTRTDVPHLRDVNLDGQTSRWFSSAKNCWVKLEDEMFWVPGIDHTSGAVFSERQLLQVKENGEFFFLSAGELQPGLSRAQDAKVLGDKVQDRRAKVFLSKRGAYFDGFGWKPIDRGQLQKMLSSLPVGETILTDVLIALLAGTVPRDTLIEDIVELRPTLQQSGLVDRLGYDANPFRSNWAKDATISPQVLLEDLAVRAAQFRELIRLEGGAAKGVFSHEQLKEALALAGVDVSRARRTLEAMKWKPVEDTKLREADWNVISGHKTKERVATAGGVAFLGFLGFLLPFGWLMVQNR